METSRKTALESELSYSFSITYQNKGLLSVNPCRLKYNRILLIHGGSGCLQIDEKPWLLSGNEIVLIAKEQVFRFEHGTSWSGYELSFDDFFWEKAPASASNCKSVLFDNAAFNQVIPLNDADQIEINQLFKFLQAEFMKDNYVNKADALAAYLKIAMIKIANINAALVEGFDTFDYKQYRSFYNMVSQPEIISHEVEEYATLLQLPARKLTAVCKRYSGKGAKELINQKLISEAKRALQFTYNPVKEIAYQLKFSSPEQFSHFFKKYVSQSPNSYRSVHVKMHS
ncbi:MAG: hypothetical protein JWP44_360 [Mucilaginibacter sp.]|nr:hypothetical protein [Mucilaginibacter sp.]